MASAIRGITLPDVIDGRYRVLGRIGSGAMGIVLRAEDLFLQRPVAIKIVDPGVDPNVSERFVKEAQSLARVRHENVVQVYAFGRFQQASYLAMELVVGHSLESIIDAHAAAQNTVALPRAMAILRAMALGLDAVHHRELVHRDVKPANVIIEKNTDRPVLIDFGLARRRSVSNPRMSLTGGTPSYMAPEQASDPQGLRIGPRTDLYALACTAFELLTGRPEFEGTDIFQVLLQHMNDAPRAISTVRPDLAAFDDILIRALAKEPNDRFASATELVSGARGAGLGARPALEAEAGGSARARRRERHGLPPFARSQHDVDVEGEGQDDRGRREASPRWKRSRSQAASRTTSSSSTKSPRPAGPRSSSRWRAGS